MTRAPHFPRPLRHLTRIVIALLVLAAVMVGLRYWLDAGGRAYLARHPSRPARPATPHAGAARSVPIAEIPFLKSLVDPASASARETDALLDELDIAFENSDLWPSASGPVDFLALLRRLHLPVPEGMTQAQAAAAFLRHAQEKYGAWLEKVLKASAAGKWDLSQLASASASERRSSHMRVFRVVANGITLCRVLAESALLAGQTDEALPRLRDMRQLSTHNALDEFGLMSVTSLIQTGLGKGLWRDSDFPSLLQELGDADPLTEYRDQLARTREEYPEALARLPGIAAGQILDPPGRKNATFEERINSGVRMIYLSTMSQTQLAANVELLEHRLDTAESAFNYRDRVYTPPPADEIRNLTQDPLGSNMWYFDPASNFHSDTPASALGQQTRLDQTRLALALETQKRATGSYPDSLDAVAPTFPAGLPHDVATGQPFSYRKNPDGTYKLWGTGIDQTNNGGDPDKDILFTLPKPQ